jgi:general secretion pathway protein D
MISRFSRLCLAAASLSVAASVPLVAQSEPRPLAIRALNNDPVGPFNMPDVPLDGMLDLVEMFTGRTVLRPAALPAGNYHFVRRTPLPKSEALLAIETLLNLNQVGLAPLGDTFIKVVPLGSLRSETPELIEGSTLGLPPSGRAASKVFSLQFLRVREFLPEIAPLLNPQFGGPMFFEKANAALITDSISTLQRVELLIQQLDRPVTAGLTPKFFPLQFAKASDLVAKINAAIGTALKPQLGSATTFSADDRTNQIVLLADPSLHAWFGELIAKLDVKADPNTRNEVIPLKHALAVDVAPVITNLVTGQTQAVQRAAAASQRPGQGLLGTQQGQPLNRRQQAQLEAQMQAQGQNPGAGPQGGEGGNAGAAAGNAPATIDFVGATGDPAGRGSEFSSLITILPDERSNSLIVSGTVDDLRLIRELVEKIDVVLPQVRIEAVIVEVSLGDNSTTGIDALGLQVAGDKLVGFNVSTPGMVVDDGDGGFAGLLRPDAETFFSGNYDLAGIIRLTTTPRKNKANILSAPSILTAHNKEGIIFVGEERPVISGYVTDANTTTGARTNVSQREIGITLTVTPLIGTDGSVELTISQEVKDVLGDILIDGNPQPRVGSRRTESVVSVKSGEIIVLGGLQRISETRNTNRLGPIPIIGDLLGRRSRETSRSDLVFFLRPVVLSNTPADNAVALDRVERMPIKDDVKRLLDPSSAPAAEERPSAGPALRRP